MSIITKKDSNEAYHSHDFIGSSVVVSGYDPKSQEVNLAKVKAYIENLTNVSIQLQKAFDYGTVQHSVVLEQDIAGVIALPEFNVIEGITKKAQVEKWNRDNPEANKKDMPEFKPVKGITIKEQIAEFKKNNPAQFYLSQSDYNKVLDSFDVVASHTEASRIISNATHVETSFYDEDTKRKCRPDLVGEDDNGKLYICNYKTCYDISRAHSDIFFKSYDIRALHEIKIVEKALGRKVDDYYFWFQDKSAPFSLRCIRLEDEDREFAVLEHERLANMVQMAIKESFFPQPVFRIEHSRVNRKKLMDDFENEVA